MQEVNSASTKWIAAAHAHGGLAPVAMLVPKVVCPRKWLVPTLGLQSLALALGPLLPGWHRWLCWFRRCWAQLNEWCHPIGLQSMKLFWAHSCLAEADGRGEPIDDLVAVMHVEVGLVLVSAAWCRMGR